MKTFAVPPTSKNALEQLATEILRDFDPEMLMKLKALDVETLIDVYMQKKFGWDTDVQEELPANIEAYSDPKTKSVVLPEATYSALSEDGRARFTACHEFSHVAKHRKTMMVRMMAFDEKSDLAFRNKRGELRSFECAEWQANYLAGALLMPEAHVLRIFASNRQSAIATIQAMASIFVVSISAAKCRLEHVLKKNGRYVSLSM